MRRPLLSALLLLLAMLPAAPASATPTTPLRVRVTAPGLQQITPSDLAAAGWDLAALDPRRIQLARRGAPAALQIAGEADGRLGPGDVLQFVAPRNGSRWTTESVYWLTVGDAPNLRGAPQLAPGAPIGWEDDSIYESSVASPRGDHWFGAELATFDTARQTMRAVLALPTPVPAGARLQVAVAAPTINPPQLTISVNGTPLPTQSWSGAGPRVLTTTIPQALAAGDLAIDLTVIGGGAQTLFVDAITLPDLAPPWPATPQTPVVAAASALDLRSGPAPGQTGASYLIITSGALRGALDPLIAAHQARGHTVGVVDVQAAYDAFSFGERDPEAIRTLIRRAAESWSPRPRAVLLVGAGSVRLRVAPGTADPNLIPPYLVDADPVRGEVACDTCYTRLDADDVLADVLPDIPLGRLPARTLAEAQTLVRKTVTHLTAPPAGAWQSRAILLTDNDYQPDGAADPAGSFVATAETAAAAIGSALDVQRFFYDPRRGASAEVRDLSTLRCRVFRALDGGSPSDRSCAPNPEEFDPGAALFVYVGHGSQWQWGAAAPGSPVPFIFYLYDVDGRKNGDRLPILLSMTCLSGDWANPTLETIDERMVRWPGGGAVASLAATGMGVNTGHARLLQGLIPRLVAAGGPRSLGAAHLAGLAVATQGGATPDLAYTFGILGDPEVQLPFVATATQYIPQVSR